MAETPPPIAVEIRPDIWLDVRRALWLSHPRLLVVADVHWGYALSHRARGNLLPVWGDDVINARLSSLLSDYDAAEMIWLGDSLHALPGRAAAELFLDRPGIPPASVLMGNHDVRWPRAREASLERDGYFFHHGNVNLPVPGDCIEVIGHHHPAVSWYDGAGGNLKLPALVDGPRRLILPAFSPWAAGVPWNRYRRADENLWAIGAKRIFRL